MNTDTLFFGAIIVALIEALLQYCWLRWYFLFGLPILVASISTLDAPRASLQNSGSLRRVDKSLILVRQKKYGIARYAYFHGFLQRNHYPTKDSIRCILFVDWNVLVVGAFLSSALLSSTPITIAIGAIAGYALAFVAAQLSRKKLLSAYVQEIASKTF